MYNTAMRYTTLFFDLDDTLYPSGNGLWGAISERMNQYMVERIGLPPEEVPALRKMYYQRYGTTLRGLQNHYQVDSDDYLAYVHDLPLERYLEPAPALRDLLSSLPQQCWIFTNADAGHARRVLTVLGVADYFDGIIDVRAIQFACKPELVAYQRALALAGNPSPTQCVLLDDSHANLAPARQAGLTTVLIRDNGLAHPAADYVLADVLALSEALPELWDLKD
ncbi:MAG: pyrimidine 5'-nucleotidase [Anaerolineales bacterium]|nr:pyrimidine 5'-nucleotidase [Anaerolineales bacterium]